MRAYRSKDSHPALYGIKTDKIVQWTRVHESTARRWKRGEDPPYSAVRLVEIQSTGNLGIIDDEWDGWCLKDGVLVAPNGEQFTSGDIMATTFWQQLAKSYQLEQKLPRQADWVAEAWVPAPAEKEFTA